MINYCILALIYAFGFIGLIMVFCSLYSDGNFPWMRTAVNFVRKEIAHVVSQG